MDFTKFLVMNLAVTFFLLSIICSSASGQNSGKYVDDEKRPYEFGFNIEGMQHRREKKDENGIIMGEFGFITADGVYHVTVYATDENGNFKILSMKNIRLNPAPFTTTTTAPIIQPLPPVPDYPQSDQPFSTAKPLPVASCASCSIPSTTKVPPPQYQPQPQYPQQPQSQYPQSPNPIQNEIQPPFGGPDQDGFLDTPQGDQYNPGNDPTGLGKPFPGSDGTPVKLISGSMQKVTPEEYEKDRVVKPGEQPGLPPRISEENMSELLYRFNYTVGFHGHWEEGYSDGVKIGGYYVNNRNGVATKITYRADNTGYHPTVERVRISPEETPVEETEKNPEFGLKGYEFKWFYVPKYHYLNQ